MTPPLPDAARVADGLLRGDRRSVSLALNLVDDTRPEARRWAHEVVALLGDAPLTSGYRVGLSGPPGSGKSSLTAALLRKLRANSLRVAVLAIDPSSVRTGGALLGDRIRMTQTERDDGIYIRSLASRGMLGGMSPETWPMTLVLSVAFDLVLVETVGVGQSEIDIANLCDTTCVVVQPASGDTIQFLKSGLMDIPDILVVAKADLGQISARTARELSLTVRRGERAVPVVCTSAISGIGVDELTSRLVSLRAEAPDARARSRREKEAALALRAIRDRIGSVGLEGLGGAEAVRRRIVLSRDPPWLACEKMLASSTPA